MTVIDDIRPKVGTLHPSLRGAGAWWIGTDTAVEGVAEYERLRKAWGADFKALAISLDCDPDRMWVNKVWGEEVLSAFTPNDPDNLAEGLRLEKGYRDKAVPAARYKAGKAIDVELNRLQRAKPQLVKVVGGVIGSVTIPGDRSGSLRTAFPQIIRPTGATHPIMVLNVDPLQNMRGEKFETDDAVWERQPLSVLHSLLEEQEATGG